MQQHPLEAVENLLRCLQQRAPASVDGFFRLSATCFFVAGRSCCCRPCRSDCADSNRALVSCINGRAGFPRQDSSNNASWFVLLRLPAGESLDQVWVNGCSVSWEIQQLQGWPCLEAVDRLLSLCCDAQVPSRSLPQVLQGCLGSACWSSVNHCVTRVSGRSSSSDRNGLVAQPGMLNSRW